MKVRVLTGVASVLAFALLGCAPPPPAEEPDAGFPDAGTLAGAGDECFSPTVANDCATGLECATLVDAAAGTFACVLPADLGGACFFNNGEVEVAPVDDGCLAGLACGGDDVCVRAGVIGAPCASPTDCESVNCGSLADGTGSVCVVNECVVGCGEGSVCRQEGRCGLTCVLPPGEGEACFVAGADPCSPVRSACQAPLECFRGDAANTTCGVPGGEGAACNLTTQDDGCSLEFRCDSTGRCVDRVAGD